MGSPILIEGEARTSQIICWRIKDVPRHWDGETRCKAWIGRHEQMIVQPLVPMSKARSGVAKRRILAGNTAKGKAKKAEAPAPEPRLVEAQTTMTVRRGPAQHSLKIPLPSSMIALGIGRFDLGGGLGQCPNEYTEVLVMIFEGHLELWRPDVLRRHLAATERELFNG